MLTLLNAHLRPLSYRHHGIGPGLADRPLFGGQVGYLITDDVGSQGDYGGESPVDGEERVTVEDGIDEEPVTATGG